jgi:hypothetical protein
VHVVNGQFEEAARELERAASEGARAPAILGLLAIASWCSSNAPKAAVRVTRFVVAVRSR